MCAATTTQTISPITRSRKLALLIGIKDYENGENLRNPENDVNAMHDKLQEIGFGVQKHINLTSHQMKTIINDFTQSIERMDLVLFYFAGHGTQWEVSYNEIKLIIFMNNHLQLFYCFFRIRTI